MREERPNFGGCTGRPTDGRVQGRPSSFLSFAADLIYGCARRALWGRLWQAPRNKKVPSVAEDLCPGAQDQKLVRITAVLHCTGWGP